MPETIEYKLMRFDGLLFGYVIFKTVGPQGVAIKKAIYLLSYETNTILFHYYEVQSLAVRIIP